MAQAERAGFLLMVLGALCVAATGEAQNQGQPIREPPHLGTGEPLIRAPVSNETMDAHEGTHDKMAREKPAVARKTCQTVPIALTHGPFVLESTPEFSVLRAHGEDSTN